MRADDIVMIQQLLGQYGHIVDAAEWERFDELFVPDAELDYTLAGAEAVYHGLAEIRDFFRGVKHPSAHHCVNIYVWEEDGVTRVRSKFFVPYTREFHPQKRWKGGDYLDVVEQTPAGWRFRARTCIARWELVPEAETDGGRRSW